ncbi:hypothetical protein NC653_030840 [Populus alba x Populus x berolinensis]|uniref:Uncharacterized protein n=1 Tax=Populus alba x Populus x berolinensis TaxID=444605 RepID=A0AAD6LWX9_9ROSI|nr:hypothetical protein NC653_030840 [Populus alba x Populus x berolinensis]
MAASSTNHYGQTWHTEARTRTLPLKPKAVLLNPARTGPEGRPGSWTGPGNTKDRGKEKKGHTRPDPGDPDRPGLEVRALLKSRQGRVYLVGVAEVWLRLVGVIEIWLMGGVIEARLWWERGRNL